MHAPVNGSEARLAIGGVPDTRFTFTITKKDDASRGAGRARNASAFFGVPEPALERWNFTWFEDLFARDAGRPSLVQVAAKAYRKVSLHEPGAYVATLTYYNGTTTEATWFVRAEAQAPARRAKNIVLFIGDGMTTAMVLTSFLLPQSTPSHYPSD